MIVADFKCENCGTIIENWKESIMCDFPKIQCLKCGSNTYRVFGVQAMEVAEGRTGNFQSSYTTNIVYHPSNIIGRVKGTKVKIK